MTSRLLKAGEEKESAFRGFCLMVPHNTSAALAAFPYICNAFVMYKEPPQDLQNMFTEIIHRFRESIGAQWQQYTVEFPNDLKEGLRSKFGVTF